MVHYVFDLDDTLIIHRKDRRIIYGAMEPDLQLSNHLNKCNGSCYIYTNGTAGHALEVIKRLGIKDHFEKIYSRDTIPYMKPHYKSFQAVQDDLSIRSNETKEPVIFFDDILENLEEASRMGWITFWIHPDAIKGEYYHYVSKSFTDIKSCFQFLETK